MKTLAIIALLALTSCATFRADTPSQRLFGIQADYNGALAVAVAYESQPRCAPVPVQPCSDTTTVIKMRAADDVAWSLLRNAQAIARNPDSAATTVSAAIDAALTAVSAFKTITGGVK